MCRGIRCRHRGFAGKLAPARPVVPHDRFECPTHRRKALDRTSSFSISIGTIAADGEGPRGPRAHRPGARRRREERETASAAPSCRSCICSPTMELGVDIASLNVVELRNVPPTPAQLRPAQRPGRAERPAGPGDHVLLDRQPARPVFLPAAAADGRRAGLAAARSTWPTRTSCGPTCTASGSLESGMSLGKSLKDVLDVAGDTPTLASLDSKRHDVENLTPRARAKTRAERVLLSFSAELNTANWWGASAGWTMCSTRLAEVSTRLAIAGVVDSRAVTGHAPESHPPHDASGRNPTRTKQETTSRSRSAAHLDLRARPSHNQIYSYPYFASDAASSRIQLSAASIVRVHPWWRCQGLGTNSFLGAALPRISQFGPRNDRPLRLAIHH